jgi:hypothetical protein
MQTSWYPEARVNDTLKVILCLIRREGRKSGLQCGGVLCLEGLLNGQGKRLEDFKRIKTAGAKACLALLLFRLCLCSLETGLCAIMHADKKAFVFIVECILVLLFGRVEPTEWGEASKNKSE